MKSIRTKNKLYKYYLANPNPANKTNYTTYKNILPQSIRVAKRLFFENQFDNYKGNIRKTWGIINQMLQRGNSRTLPDYIMNGNTTLDDPVMMANAFNTFFVNIGENLASEICGEGVNFTDYFAGNYHNSCYFYPTDRWELIKIINNLETNKAPGFDGIHVNVIKKISNVVVDPLVYIFNLSFQKGDVPRNLKIAKVIPLYKSGDKHLIKYYRPVSLLPLLSKIL